MSSLDKQHAANNKPWYFTRFLLKILDFAPVAPIRTISNISIFHLNSAIFNRKIYNFAKNARFFAALSTHAIAPRKINFISPGFSFCPQKIFWLYP